MDYEVDFTRQAERDIAALSPEVARRITQKIRIAQHDLNGNIRRLVNFSPSYRLRVGDWRVLFEIEANKLVVHRILHRREAYE